MEASSFANTINSLDNGLSHANMSECMSFGITWGCRSHCPVFERGECSDCYYENIEQFIKSGDVDKEEVKDIIDKYRNRLTNEEAHELTTLNNQ